jgi:5-methylcytosine-specific restriction endonuclease McrA
MAVYTKPYVGPIRLTQAEQETIKSRQRASEEKRKRKNAKQAKRAAKNSAKKERAEVFLQESIRRNARYPAKTGDFYRTREWASVRYAALMKSDGRCKCCGASSADGAVLHVDHIKPRSLFPSLEFSLSNLQVLCDLCNIAKSNIDMTNWKIKHDPEDPRGAAYRENIEEEARIFRQIKDIVGKD